MASPWFVDNVRDEGLEWLETNATRAIICSGEPANYAAVAGVTLATHTISGTNWTISDGDTSGRKIRLHHTTGVNDKLTGVNASATGTATHIVFTDGTSTLIGHTPCTSISVNSGSAANILAYDVLEQEDP